MSVFIILTAFVLLVYWFMCSCTLLLGYEWEDDDVERQVTPD